MSAISPLGPGPSPAHAAVASPEDRLKKTAFQLEGLFVQRLFAAMRDTVPDDGLVSQNAGESTFTGLLDEKFAEQVPTQWSGSHSLAQALYHQLRQRLAPPATQPTSSDTPQ